MNSVLPSGKEYCRCSLSWSLQLEVQWRKKSLPFPLAIRVIGDDWDPMESIKVSEILEPFFPLKMTVCGIKKWKWFISWRWRDINVKWWIKIHYSKLRVCIVKQLYIFAKVPPRIILNYLYDQSFNFKISNINCSRF